MIRLIIALCVLVGVLGQSIYTQHLRAEKAALETVNEALKGNVAALQKKIETDAKVSAADQARAEADVKRITTFKEKSRATIKGLTNPGRVALDRDATDRLRAIFNAGH